MRNATLAAGLLALSLTGAMLAPTDAGAGPGKAAPAGVDAPYAGFTTPGVRAGGGYLGAHRVGGTVVYRIDPGRKAAATSFGAATPVPLLAGSGKRKVTLSDTQRAAWIVSKYGAFPAKVQAAAVELALDDLLVGGAYGLRGVRTRARLATLRKPADVVDLATTMLKGSRQRAGDYRVDVEAPAVVDAGSPVTVRVQVVATASAVGVASLPVAVTLGGQQVDATTGPDGAAVATLPATVAGLQSLEVRVDKVPESRLLVLSPSEPRASRLVVAQVKAQRLLTRPLAVRALPVVAVTSDVHDVAAASSVPVRYVVTGNVPGAAARAARGTLFGPQPTPTCTGPVAGTVSTTTAAPTLAAGTPVAEEGWYSWQVDVAGDTVHAPSSACGGATFVHLPTFTLGANSSPGQVTVTVHWLPPGYTGSGTMTFFAPPTAGQPTCSKPLGGSSGTRSFSLTADGQGDDFFFFTPPSGTYAIGFKEAGARVDRCETVATAA